MKLHYCQRCLLAVLTLAQAAAPTLAAHTPDAIQNKLGSIQPNAHYRRFIVSFRQNSAEQAKPLVAMHHLRMALHRTDLTRQNTNAPLLRLSYRHHLATGGDLVSSSRPLNAAQANALMRQIATDPAVVYVEPDATGYLINGTPAPARLQSSVALKNAADTQRVSRSYPWIWLEPNDPLFHKYQWNFTGLRGGIDIVKAWAKSRGKGIIVADLDTGITRHPDLDTSLADDSYDFVTDHNLSGRPVDGRAPGGWDPGDWTKHNVSTWHGTHVAGIIAELTNNGIGLAGVAPEARVLPVRVLGKGGMGSASDTADAIIWAAGLHVDGVPDNKHPAQVINLSIRFRQACTPNSAIRKAIATALAHGTTIVAAAGNDKANINTISPAGCPGIIVVSSNDINGKPAPYSDYGKGVTLSAPGGSRDGTITGSVWSTMNASKTTPGKPVYGAKSGTSQATPEVAGTVALILSAEKAAGKPLSTPAQIKAILTETARPFPVKPKKPMGAGILDVSAAVNKALNG